MMPGPQRLGDLFCLPLKNLNDAQAIVLAVDALLAEWQLTFRPPPPIPATCCGRGCNGCVWLGYFEALACWRDEAGELLVTRTKGQSIGKTFPVGR